MIEVQGPEQPAGGSARAGRRGAPARRRARARRNARLGIGASAALAVMTAGGTVMATGGTAMAAGSSAKAQRPAAAPFSVTGVLESVGQKSLAFKLADGTVATATLTSSTTYTKTENLKASALSNGERVTVLGATTNGVVAASRIVVTPSGSGFGGGFRGRNGQTPGSLPEGFRPRPPGEGFRARGEGFPPGAGFNLGTISGLSGGSFTLTEPNKAKVKVTTSASTVVTKTVRTDKKGLTVGQELLIRGREVNNTTVAAASVTQGNAGFFTRGGGGPGAGGPRARSVAPAGGTPPTS